MEWFDEYGWQIWTGLMVLLAAAELLSLDLVLLMLAAGAGVGILTALIGLPVAAQIIAALATSVAMLALVRPGIVKRLHSGPELTLGHDALVGKQGVVVAEVSADSGQVRINGELWTARAYDETRVIPEGARVDVFQIKGATALVHEIPRLDPPPNHSEN
ncbi:NfeD family protein [Nocardioides mesophilus]|uniref:NfeD family protein n=1 Tax=Nocardioides mesophilus TaxID=433659 RepID=A0A7G9RB87_9ACTN|nr:NfeD family protein [Nocardioides mesophilus]QNN52862.1 NfeD family protein [Nocardioides mesophilus]